MGVLVISDNGESSTLLVEEWLVYFGCDYFVTNFAEFGQDNQLCWKLNDEKEEFRLGNGKRISSVWFRSDVSGNSPCHLNDKKYIKTIEKYLLLEVETLKRSLFKANTNTRWLSNYESNQLDKLKVLSIAREIGLNIPDTIVTTSKVILNEFFHRYGSVICKSAFENIPYIKTEKGYLKNFVDIIESNMLESLPDSFFPSFFQRMIAKDFDVRVFFLDGKLYPMAIFSGSIDYRADYALHRNVPLKLPEVLEGKICRLMDRLGLNTGSLDFVKSSEDGKFYFLEVNPNGQFGMVSEPCNYYLEREIAKFLCHEE